MTDYLIPATGDRLIASSGNPLVYQYFNDATVTATQAAQTAAAVAHEAFRVTAVATQAANTATAAAHEAFRATVAATQAAATAAAIDKERFVATVVAAQSAATAAAVAHETFLATVGAVQASNVATVISPSGTPVVVSGRSRPRGGGGGRAKPAFEYLGTAEMRLLDWMPHAGPVPDELKPGRIFRIKDTPRSFEPMDFGPLPMPPADVPRADLGPVSDLAARLDAERKQAIAAQKAAVERQAAAEAEARAAEAQRVADLEAARRRRRQRDEEALMWLLAA